jgi:hypothetical protein
MFLLLMPATSPVATHISAAHISIAHVVILRRATVCVLGKNKTSEAENG